MVVRFAVDWAEPCRLLAGRAVEKNGKKERKEANYDFLLKKLRFALAYVRKKQYLCREKCSFANIASEIIRKTA